MAAIIWPQWVSASCTSSTTTMVWHDWVSITSSTNSLFWQGWMEQSGTTTAGHRVFTAPSVAEKADMAARHAAAMLAEDARRKAAAAACERAERLLLARLPERQRRQRRQEGFFDVKGSAGRLYRIHAGIHGNVREIERQPDGTIRAVARLCCQPNAVPEADAHLAQYLWLKHDEERFRRVANITPYPRPPAVPA